MQDVVLALLAKEPSHGYELRSRLQEALGPVGDALNAGQVYVTLTRLEKAGLVTAEHVGQAHRPDRKVYALTAEGRGRVDAWLADLTWGKPSEFHLKLVAAAAARLADPVDLVEAQRGELLRRLAEVQRAVLNEPDGSVAAPLIEGVALRLEADLRWLDACARYWERKG
ncbi:PadR family transcriptional regulator [Actinoallomurus spadix]|uniref:PadR family transcriptional regulator n=1 Tax=Actinoallomurus spadix TaxID=79912 RepID=A0ABN0W789_9ACTN|nr:PadR family transcriptional regulator [Actinoallomurus spadix]MCO5986360.1 PadR family transcriptional regulator [Actinoallomurus spadix]